MDILKDVPESIGTLYGEKNEKYLRCFQQGGYWKDIDPDIAK